MRASGVAPSQGRGSKHLSWALRSHVTTSPHHRGADRNFALASTAARSAVAPSQGRGSKPLTSVRPPAEVGRPITGARIETPRTFPRTKRRPCRPITGARIETRIQKTVTGRSCVAPSQGRGSKQRAIRADLFTDARRPITGARIETYARQNRVRDPGRPITGARIETGEDDRQPHLPPVAPSQGRGSKHPHGRNRPGRRSVAPSQGRGSKLSLRSSSSSASSSRPITGARIETASC